MDPPNGVPPRPKNFHYPGEPLNKSKFEDAVNFLNSLVETWGPDDFAEATRLMSEYHTKEPKMLHPSAYPDKSACLGRAPVPMGIDLLKIKETLVELAKTRRSMHCDLERIRTDLSVLINGGAQPEDQKCKDVMEDIDWASMGIWNLLELLTTQTQEDHTELVQISGHLNLNGLGKPSA